jgi:hypothetical protein
MKVEEEIKSALEIAMERVATLPELTPEDIAGQKEKESRFIGEALCNNYLQDRIERDRLSLELSRYKGEQGRIAREAFVACLCRSIRLDDPSTAVTAIEALAGLVDDGDALREKVSAAWLRILDDYQRSSEVLRNEFEHAARQRLADQGIAGSAILPNMGNDEAFTQASAGLHRSFEPRLQELANGPCMKYTHPNP